MVEESHIYIELLLSSFSVQTTCKFVEETNNVKDDDVLRRNPEGIQCLQELCMVYDVMLRLP